MDRTLGIYVCFAALAQIALNTLAYFDPESDWLFYFDPRIGLCVLESRAEVFPGISSWASAAILLGIGIGMSLRALTVRTYLIVEAILASPTVLFLLLVLVANMNPSHGFSVAELLYPVIVFIAISGIPFWLGVQSHRSKNRQGQQASDRLPASARQVKPLGRPHASVSDG